MSGSWSQHTVLPATLRPAVRTPPWLPSPDPSCWLISPGFAQPSFTLEASDFAVLRFPSRTPCRSLEEPGERGLKPDFTLQRVSKMSFSSLWYKGKETKKQVCLKLVSQTSIFLVNLCSKFSLQLQNKLNFVGSPPVFSQAAQARSETEVPRCRLPTAACARRCPDSPSVLFPPCHENIFKLLKNISPFSSHMSVRVLRSKINFLVFEI